MVVVGVIDLLNGRAVHAYAGHRESYAPISGIAGSPVQDGSPGAVARSYVSIGVPELYVADLNAIAGRQAQDEAIGELAGMGLPLWLDAAITGVDGAHQAIALGATRLVVGLETLASFEALEDICSAVGGRHVTFSLDLRHGEPVARESCRVAGAPAHLVAAQAAQAGVGAVIVLDLARVGTRSGVDLRLIDRIRRTTHRIPLLAGGGVRGLEDLRRLADAGCEGAIVATALQDGRLGPADIAAARRFGVPSVPRQTTPGPA